VFAPEEGSGNDLKILCDFLLPSPIGLPEPAGPARCVGTLGAAPTARGDAAILTFVRRWRSSAYDSARFFATRILFERFGRLRPMTEAFSVRVIPLCRSDEVSFEPNYKLIFAANWLARPEG
jgi:hypothetical protein